MNIKNQKEENRKQRRKVSQTSRMNKGIVNERIHECSSDVEYQKREERIERKKEGKTSRHFTLAIAKSCEISES